MLDAYACTMPAADPFSALTASWIGAVPVRTIDASKSCGIVSTIVTSPRSSASLASSGDSDCSSTRKCPDARNRVTSPRERLDRSKSTT